MAEDKKKDEIAVIEINEEFMKQKLYEFRGCKVLLDADRILTYLYVHVVRFGKEDKHIMTK